MVDFLAKSITSKLIEYGSVDEEEHEEYAYALTLIITIIVTDITTMAIGFVMGMFWECVGFCFIYKVLRKYCGGYHFSTSLKCYLSTCVMCPAALLMIRYCSDSLWLLSNIWVVSAVALLILSPVEAENKPLDEKEQKVFGIVARIIVLVLCMCYFIFTMIKFFTVLKTMTVSIAFVSLFAIIGKVHLKNLEKEKEEASFS